MFGKVLDHLKYADNFRKTGEWSNSTFWVGFDEVNVDTLEVKHLLAREDIYTVFLCQKNSLDLQYCLPGR